MNGADFLKTQSCTCAGMVMLKFIFIIGFHWSIYFATGRTLFKALVLNFHPFTVEALIDITFPVLDKHRIPRWPIVLSNRPAARARLKSHGLDINSTRESREHSREHH